MCPFFPGLELAVQPDNIDICSISPDSSSCYTSTSSETELLTVKENDTYSKQTGSHEDIVGYSSGQEVNKICEKDSEIDQYYKQSGGYKVTVGQSSGQEVDVACEERCAAMAESKTSSDIGCEKDVVSDEGTKPTLEKLKTDVDKGELDEFNNGIEVNGKDISESDLQEVSNKLVTEVLQNLQQDIMNENTLRGETIVSILEKEVDSFGLEEAATTVVDPMHGEESDTKHTNVLDTDEMKDTGFLREGSSGLNELNFLEKDPDGGKEVSSISRTNDNVVESLQASDTEDMILTGATQITSSDSVETPEKEHATGFYDINSQNDELMENIILGSSAMNVSAITTETVSPVETPENEHAKGFYEVNPEKELDNLLDLESSAMIVSTETISPVETPEYEHARGFYEVNPVISVSVMDTKDELDDNLVEENRTQSENDKLHAELTETVLQNIDIGQISSPVESPLDDHMAGNYQINPMIPDITIDEVIFEDAEVKSDVIDLSNAGSGGVRDEKFKELTSNLVNSVINGAIQIVVNMKQTGSVALNQIETEQKSIENVLHMDEASIEKDLENVTESDKMFVKSSFEIDEMVIAENSNRETNKSNVLHDSDNMETANDEILIETNKETLYPEDSDSDDSAGSSTTTEGSYRIINSRDTSPLNTPENTSSLEEFISNQRDKSSAERELQKSKVVKAENDDLRDFNDTKNTAQERNVSQNVHENITTQNVGEISGSNNDEANERNRNDTEHETKEKTEYNVMDIGDSVVFSEISSEESDYMKEHKLEYKTRKQIFMTSAGRMSISIDSVMDPPSDPDQSYIATEKETIHEERDTVQEDARAEVNYIIARAQSIVGHADETLARLSDATIARLREMAHAAIVDDASLADLDVVYDYTCSSVLCEVLLL